MRSRKMKPYCLSSKKSISPTYLEAVSFEDYMTPAQAKKARKDREIMKRYEKKAVRQNLKRELDDELRRLGY